MTNQTENPLLIASYEILEGTACAAPYVDCSISMLIGRNPPAQVKFKARVDTGADVSCVPQHIAEPYMKDVLLGRPISIRLGGSGATKRVKTMLFMVTLHCDDDNHQSFRPERGVLITNSPIGLLGMDILRRLDVRFHNDQVYIYPNQNGGE